MTIKHPHCEWVTKFEMTDSYLFPTISSFLLGLWYEQNRHWLPLQHRKQTLSDYDLSLLFRQFVISLLCGQLAFEGTTESEHSNKNQGGACYDCKRNEKGEIFLGYSDEKGGKGGNVSINTIKAKVSSHYGHNCRLRRRGVWDWEAFRRQLSDCPCRRLPANSERCWWIGWGAGALPFPPLTWLFEAGTIYWVWAKDTSERSERNSTVTDIIVIIVNGVKDKKPRTGTC